MKKLIFLELAFLFLATTFSSSPPPPGWYQQTLPVNDQINDIYFLDSLNGWVVTNGSANDTAYIMKTTNGGENWEINYKTFIQFTAIQFADSNIGYACGIGPGAEFFKSTNGGDNWNILNVLTFTWKSDLKFINKDTGWVCSTDPFDGGLFKTTDGGISWVRQLNGTYKPSKVFFVNNDTGWIASNTSSNNLYRTTNGGANWGLQFTFPFSNQINDIFFMSDNNGVVSSGRNYRTTNGGFNWALSLTNVGGIKLSMISDLSGWAGVNFNIISKTTDGGISWFYQSSPIIDNTSVSGVDSLEAWAGGNGLVHTISGGDTLTEIQNIGNVIPSNFILYQNYPNPFNPTTTINYELRTASNVKLIVYDIKGKEITTLVNQKQNTGEYKVTFDGSGFTSGIYFYKMEINNDKSDKYYTETKKMILIK